VLQGLAGFGYEYLIGMIKERSTFRLRSEVFGHMHRLPLEFYDQNRMGDLVKRMTDDAGKIRVSKLMSEQGLCSRREADEFIERGLVFVDGVRVAELGTRIDPTQTITLARAAQDEQVGRVTILLHKPVGYVSGQAEDGYQPASKLIGESTRWHDPRAPRTFAPAHMRGLAPAGRLDIDSTGLIVFTQDGRIAKELIGENSRIEKEYLVRVEGRLSREGLALLNFGLALDGEALRPAKVSWQNEDQLRFVLRQGKKRQIRRMCELVGLEVKALKRVRIGSVLLGSLPVGQWRYLRADEHFGSPAKGGVKTFVARAPHAAPDHPRKPRAPHGGRGSKGPRP
jgi:23S rRNA pseudouridine2604 synthase